MISALGLFSAVYKVDFNGPSVTTISGKGSDLKLVDGPLGMNKYAPLLLSVAFCVSYLE